MIDRWEAFRADIDDVLDISEKRWRYIRAQTRPKSKENTKSHRRSGNTKGYLSKLEDSTIVTLNNALAPELSRLGYS